MTLRSLRALSISLLLLTLLLVACAGDALPTLAPTAEPPPESPTATAIPAAPLPPPAIITVPAGASGSAAFNLPVTGLSADDLIAGGTSPQVVIQSGVGGTIPPEVQRLLDDLDSGAILLNSSPAGPDGQSVDYAYRDLNQDGVRDLVVIVVAEPAGQAGSAATELEGEPVQAFGIHLDALVQSLSADPNAPLVRSAFVYTLSQEELDRLDNQ